ncbi:MAG: low molecular weight phosphotyrosine protein phosphatase [Clostridia bacterium]|nr:low molecular weight phosphotyrosine protein phosphatase [Clostridia bacterium]
MKNFSVMFVCHGNICRSPMAEYILKDMARKRGVFERLIIASSATSTEEIWEDIGNPVYPPARAELVRRGVPCGSHRAVQLKRSDYEKYDLFLCMDSANLRNAARILGGDPEGKCRKLMSYVPRGGDVADPWYSGRFDVAFDDIFAGCEGLLDTLF